MRILAAILAPIAILLAVTFGVMMITGALPQGVRGFVAPPLITLATLGLLHLYRRLTGRRPPWAGLGLTRTWWAPVQVLAGVAMGLAALFAGMVVTVWAGAADWGPAEPMAPAQLIIGTALIVLRAGFPEELLIRGHLWDVLSDRFGPRAVLVITSVSFGLLHLFSQSAASGIGERVLFTVQAIALFLLCGATRERTGAIWTAVGVHTAVYLGQLIPIKPGDYGVQLAFQTVTLALAAALVLAAPRLGSAPRAARPDLRR